MGRPRKAIPTYCKHPRTNTARVWHGGKWVLLGRYNSPESRAEYARICAGSEPAEARGGVVTVAELIVGFKRHAEEYHVRPDGTRTKEVDEYKQAMRVVSRLHSKTPAAEFGPVALKAVRDAMVRKGWCRSRVNKQVGRVRRMFKWAVSEQLVDQSVWAALKLVDGLRKKRSAARETAPVEPVADAVFLATLPHAPPTVRAMLRTQRLGGLRPVEVRHLTPADLDRTGELWVYRPDDHKMAHLGITKAIPLPPSARAVIEPFLEGKGPDDVVFSPTRAREEMYAERRSRRRSKVTPSQVSRRTPPATHRKKWTTRFTDTGYAALVRRACDRAFPPTGDLARLPGEYEVRWWARLTEEQRGRVKAWRAAHRWHPNQLRHAFGTEVRERFDLDTAQALLGHQHARTSEIYAQKTLAKAAAAAAAMG